METLKTAVVVVLLLAILFGVYSVLNKPEGAPPKEIAWATKGGPDALSLDITSGGGSGEPAELGLPSKFDKKSDKKPGAFEMPDLGSNKGTEKSSGPAPDLSSFSESTKNSATARDGSPGSASIRSLAPVPVPDLASGGRFADAGRGPSDEKSKPSRYEWPPSSDMKARFARDGERAASDAGSEKPDPRLSQNFAEDTRNSIPAPHEPASPSSGGRPPLSPVPNYDRLSNSSDSSPVKPASATGTDGIPQVQPNPYVSNIGSEVTTDNAASSGGSRYAKTSAVDRGIQNAQSQIAENKYRDALLSLSLIYADPSLTTSERNKLHEWLDPLAAKVIYSTEHLADAPYVVQRGDTLITIAKQCRVPMHLLQNINGVRNPEVLVPESQLKVVRGPFRAEVDLGSKELTLYVQRMYAGRFPISVGSEPPPMPGEYDVRSKEIGHTYFARDGQNIPESDPRNPYGRCWIDLGRDLCIHGSSQVDTGNPQQGCIGLSPQDANDVMGILSPGSKVLIRR